MSLAHGGRLTVARKEFFHNSTRQITFYDNKGASRLPGSQHFIDFENHAKALVSRYFDKGPLPAPVLDALDWMLVPTNFDAIRFLSVMTSIETLAGSQLLEEKGTVIDPEDFNQIKTGLKAVVKNAGLPESATSIFMNKIGGFNRHSLSQRVNGLLEFYDVYRRDLEPPQIKALCDLRNNIIHVNVHSDEQDLWPSIILARELVTRVFLAELGFVGTYYCYIGGRQLRNFPEGTNVGP